MAFDALALQYTVDPETIQPSFLDDNNREIGARARSRLLLEQRKTLQKLCRTSPLGRECLDIVSPAPGAREVITQVERDSSIETKIAARSVRIAASSGRDLTSCIFASRMGSAPHSGERSGRYPLPMGSSLTGRCALPLPMHSTLGACSE